MSHAGKARDATGESREEEGKERSREHFTRLMPFSMVNYPRSYADAFDSCTFMMAIL
jgi:hypothetical protein